MRRIMYGVFIVDALLAKAKILLAFDFLAYMDGGNDVLFDIWISSFSTREPRQPTL
jgi:hypothetical protein